MIRTIISLDPADKSWLDRQAKAEGVSMTEIVRRAIHQFRQEQEEIAAPTLEALLEQTHGLWKKGDGLAYQHKIRAEWD